jgi:hypothetical protein
VLFVMVGREVHRTAQATGSIGPTFLVMSSEVETSLTIL